MANDSSTSPSPSTNAEIATELVRIAKILALSVVRTAKREEQVGFLSAVGYTPGEIATILDVPANAVSVILYQQKKKKKHKARSRRKN